MIKSIAYRFSQEPIKCKISPFYEKSDKYYENIIKTIVHKKYVDTKWYKEEITRDLSHELANLIRKSLKMDSYEIHLNKTLKQYYSNKGKAFIIEFVLHKQGKMYGKGFEFTLFREFLGHDYIIIHGKVIGDIMEQSLQFHSSPSLLKTSSSGVPSPVGWSTSGI